MLTIKIENCGEAGYLAYTDDDKVKLVVSDSTPEGALHELAVSLDVYNQYNKQLHP